MGSSKGLGGSAILLLPRPAGTAPALASIAASRRLPDGQNTCLAQHHDVDVERAGWTRRRVGGTVARTSSEESAPSPSVSERRKTMSDVGKTNIAVMWTVGPDDVAEGDRIFDSHVDWMTGHPRDGDAALLSSKVSKGPERSNPVDPNSELTPSSASARSTRHPLA
jgi:hypothetical protein